MARFIDASTSHGAPALTALVKPHCNAISRFRAARSAW